MLGVPLFAVIVEIVGWRKKDGRFDKLAYEFISLPSVAYATTAAFGGRPAFALFTLYPTFMGYMAGVFKDVMFVYALLFFAETFLLYLYYYGWNWLQGRAPFSQPLRWALKGLATIALVAGATLFFGLWGPEMRGDTRSFIVFLYFLPLAVGLYITAGYWFTSSTSFANPAVTVARSFTNTFSGIYPPDAPLFIVAQLIGAVAATLTMGWLWARQTG